MECNSFVGVVQTRNHKSLILIASDHCLFYLSINYYQGKSLGTRPKGLVFLPLDQGLAIWTAHFFLIGAPDLKVTRKEKKLALVPASCNSLTAQLHSFISKLIQSASLSVQLTAVLHRNAREYSLLKISKAYSR